MPNQTSENQLVKRLKKCESDALGELYDNYSHAMYGMAIQTLKSSTLAEEVVQDTFLKVWKNINSYDPSRSKLYTWMLNILRNTVIDKLRSRDYKLSIKSDEIGYNVYQGGGQVTQPFVDGVGVKNLLEGMDQNQRHVIELTYFLGYTQSEIAKEFDIPLGTVKTRLRSALNYLRKKLDVK